MCSSEWGIEYSMGLSTVPCGLDGTVMYWDWKWLWETSLWAIFCYVTLCSMFYYVTTLRMFSILNKISKLAGGRFITHSRRLAEVIKTYRRNIAADTLHFRARIFTLSVLQRDFPAPSCSATTLLAHVLKNSSGKCVLPCSTVSYCVLLHVFRPSPDQRRICGRSNVVSPSWKRSPLRNLGMGKRWMEDGILAKNIGRGDQNRSSIRLGPSIRERIWPSECPTWCAPSCAAQRFET